MRKQWWIIAALLFVLIGNPAPAPTTAQIDDEIGTVTLRLSDYGIPATLEPALAHMIDEIHAVTNLFVGLTDYDPETVEVIPMLATEWGIDSTGRIWTFHLRDDVPWVSYDPDTGAFEQLRAVTAGDVVYAVQRMCSDPNFGYYAVDVFAPLIAGCEAALERGNGESVQINAPDDSTVVMTLNAPYSAFLEMTPLWTIRPVPREAIETYGNQWTRPGYIITSGPFALEALDEDNGVVLVRNPHFPEALRGPGNIERVEIAPWGALALELFGMGYLARTDIPAGDHAYWANDPDFTGQVVQSPAQSVFYFGFTMDRPPMDNVHLRRAFSAAIDREAFLQEFFAGEGTPMAHFTPAGVAFAPPLEADFDVGYDPEFARQQMVEAGYPDCVGLPQIEVAVTSGTENWGRFITASVQRELGCSANRFQVATISLSQLLNVVDPHNPAQNRPHLWGVLGWNPDYGHAHTYIGVLACGETNEFARECNAIDNLINKAQSTTDPILREYLYPAIEEALFGSEGEFPLIPLYQENTYFAVQSWFQGPHATDGAFTGPHYDHYTIDVSTCTISAYWGRADLYRAPSFMAEVIGTLEEGESLRGIGQTTDKDGLRWWQLENEAWIPAWDATTEGFCDLLPVITIPNV